MSATDERCVVSGYPHTLRLELHRALDAAGIDYWVAQGLTFWNCPDGRECVAYGFQANGKPKLAVKIVGITDPEQAIAATLGDDGVGRSNDGVTHAYEQRIVGDGNDWGEIMCSAFDDLMAAAGESCTSDELKALESHIAATLGSETCEKLPQLGDTVCIVKRGGAEMEFGYWRCSECGCENFEGAKYCMNCGKKVKR